MSRLFQALGRYDVFTEEILTHVSAIEVGSIVPIGDL